MELATPIVRLGRDIYLFSALRPLSNQSHLKLTTPFAKAKSPSKKTNPIVQVRTSTVRSPGTVDEVSRSNTK